MHRILLSLVIITFIIRLIWIYRSEKWDYNLLKTYLDKKISQFYKILMMSDIKNHFYRCLRNFFIAISILLFIILAFTGIIPVIIFGEQMSGILLIIHVTVAPFFAFGLMLTAIFWAHSRQFDYSDYIYIKDWQDKQAKNNPKSNPHQFWFKILFWLFLTFSVPAILSMIFSMFPYFGTEGQIAMLNIHRYTTLVLLIIVLIYADFNMSSSLRSMKEDQVKE